MGYTVLAKVKFNAGIALVLDRKPVLEYQRQRDLMWGTDGLFYNCYENQSMGATWKAFAGRKFNIKLTDGEIVRCVGQWWDAGYGPIGEILGIKFCSATVGTIESLKECYVYQGYCADKEKFAELLKACEDMPVYGYKDYEKIIKYDDERRKLWRQIDKLNRDKRKLITAVKDKHAKLVAIYQG